MIKFIAEVSSNHSRNLERCFDFIDRSAEIGCSAVKFQLFRANQLFYPGALPDAEMARRKDWELPLEFIPKLADRCHKVGVEFSCTPFYLQAVAELDPFVDFYKIASYELLWDDLLIACARTNKPIILSTGMANLEEIMHALMVLKKYGCPSPTLLHCTSAYPTPYQEANLSSIETMRKMTKCEVGWSDHTVEPAVIQRAIYHWGAKVIEFHLDLDGMGEEYASGHCWLPGEIQLLISGIKKGICADGSGMKGPAPSEMKERLWRADPSDGLRPLKELRKNLS